MIMNIRHSALIGHVLAALRNAAGISQAELAVRSGIAATQISKYETIKVIPDVATVAVLLDAMGWRLAAITKLEAETYDRRADVVRAAQMVSDAFSDEGTDSYALTLALAELDRAEQVAIDQGHVTEHETPAELIARLRHEISRLRADRKHYETLVSDVREALNKAGHL